MANTDLGMFYITLTVKEEMDMEVLRYNQLSTSAFEAFAHANITGL